MSLKIYSASSEIDPYSAANVRCARDNYSTPKTLKATKRTIPYSDFVEEELSDETKFALSPNPVIDYITVNTNELNVNYTVYDLTGFEILRGQLKTNMISVSHLKPGIYFAKFNSVKDGKVYEHKFIKK